MKSTFFLSLLIFQFSLTLLFAQKSKFDANIYNFSPPEGAIIKSYPDYNNFTYKDYLSYLDTLMYSDQYYRIIQNKNPKEYPLYKFKVPNDQNNTTILLMLLKKFGWPCSSDPKKSYSAFLVVWHRRGEPEIYKQFEPYVKVAYQKKCINSSFHKMLNELFLTGKIIYE